MIELALNQEPKIESTSDQKPSACVLMVCPDDKRFNSRNLKKYINFLHQENLNNNNSDFDSLTIIYAGGTLKKYSNLVKNINEGEIIKNNPSEPFEDKVKRIKQEMIKSNTNNSQKQEWLQKIQFNSWDKIITNHPNCTKFLEQAKDWYQQDSNFQSQIDLSIASYLKNYGINATSKESQAWQNALSYKLNEIAGLLVKKALGFKKLAYPGDLCPGLNSGLIKINQLQVNNNHTLDFVKIPFEDHKKRKLVDNKSNDSLNPYKLEELLKSIELDLLNFLARAKNLDFMESIRKLYFVQQQLSSVQEKLEDYSKLVSKDLICKLNFNNHSSDGGISFIKKLNN